MFPTVAGVVETRRRLTEWVHDVGLAALEELLHADAEAIAGPKGRHRAGRTHNHWGWVPTEVAFGGRRVTVRRPRVRGPAGEEPLPTLAHLRGDDPLSDRVVNQILLGVSTRGYARSLEPAPSAYRSRGASKSAASRRLVKRTASRMRGELSSSLGDVTLAALMIDGICIEQHTVVVALGITVDGRKVPLGLWLGSTENARLCTELLQSLLERGLKVEDPILCVTDGGKGIRKALSDVLGDLTVVQRCQVHKRRNVREHLPRHRHAYVGRVMNEAYGAASADVARRRLRALANWLTSNGEDDAAASLREGLEETLTVMKLGLPPTLRRSLSTTNSIENLLGTVRRVSRNVKRWRNGNMARRWATMGVLHAKGGFRRYRGFKHLPVLVAALKARKSVDRDEQVA